MVPLVGGSCDSSRGDVVIDPCHSFTPHQVGQPSVCDIVGKATYADLSTSYHIKPGPLGEGRLL